MLPSKNAGPAWNEQTRKYLEDSRRRVPRYLFRGFSPKSGGGPNDGVLLNSEQKIVPLAFAMNKWHKSIYNIPAAELYTVVFGHLYGSEVPTEFSSWSGSIATALDYTGFAANSHLAIIDTDQFIKWNQAVPIFYVPYLLAARDANPRPKSHDIWDHEFLAHGVIEGNGLAVANIKDLWEAGLDAVYNRPLLKGALTEDEVASCKKLALNFNKDWAVVAVTLALLCIYHIDCSVTDTNLKCIEQGLGGLKVPFQEFRADKSAYIYGMADPMTDRCFAKFLVVSHALQDKQWGKGARRQRHPPIYPSQGSTVPSQGAGTDKSSRLAVKRRRSSRVQPSRDDAESAEPAAKRKRARK
ncbi:hypothetical protein LTR66_001725 [Elasticomyces elasticus]|nr:hypothetical protein LTR28_013467 [Elasticomyces elasticus]KAK4999191.1 hypothetical protein LTR66_001725 [Elasticomyces elasticus]